MKRILYLFFIVLIGVFLGLWFSSPSRWGGGRRFSLVTGGEEVVVFVADPSANMAYLIHFSPEIMVEASHRLGDWRMGSLWGLGQQEKLGGELLRTSVMRTYKIPIDAWTSSSNFYKGGGTLSLRERVSLFLFLKKLPKSGISEFTVQSDSLPERLRHAFVLTGVVEEGANVGISNVGGGGVLGEIVSLVEGMGGRVVSVEDGEDIGDFDCEVTGMGETAREISGVFVCKLNRTKPDNNLDMEIKIGKKFADRF